MAWHTSGNWQRTCPECGTEFTRRRVDQSYCGAKCNASAENRGLKRARTIYRCLYWWRYQRKHSARDLLFICRSIRDWIDEDRAAGRGPPPRHDHSRDRGYIRRRTSHV